MATISTPQYLLDQAKRRFTPSVNNFPGMGLVERRLRNTDWSPRKLADPPPGSGLKPVMGDRGLPILGHLIEMLRGGPDYLLFLYQTKGPVIFGDSPVLPGVAALAPTPRRSSTRTAIRTTRSKAGLRLSARSSTAA
jgi:hypothetical protein